MCVIRNRDVTWYRVSVNISSITGVSGTIGIFAVCCGVAVVVIIFPFLTGNQCSLSRILVYCYRRGCLEYSGGGG